MSASRSCSAIWSRALWRRSVRSRLKSTRACQSVPVVEKILLGEYSCLVSRNGCSTAPSLSSGLCCLRTFYEPRDLIGRMPHVMLYRSSRACRIPGPARVEDLLVVVVRPCSGGLMRDVHVDIGAGSMPEGGDHVAEAWTLRGGVYRTVELLVHRR